MASRFYLGEGTAEEDLYEIVGEAASFDAALRAGAQMLTRGHSDSLEILAGDQDGPREIAAHLERADVAGSDEAGELDAELVMTIVEPWQVPPSWRELARKPRPVTELEHGPRRGGGKRDMSTVYVQLDPEADDASKRFAEIELNPKGLTKKGERMYRHVIEGAKSRAKVLDAKRIASATVMKAAGRGVPGLVRKPKRNACDRDETIASVVREAAIETAPWAASSGKRFVSDVYATLVAQGRDDGMSLAEFKSELVRLSRAGLVSLARADLVAAMPAKKVKQSEIDWQGATFHFVDVRKNPGEIVQEDADAAVDKYKEFHRYDPKSLEELGSLKIPSRVRKLGAAKYVLYRSGKVDPGTLKKPPRAVDYIHEHDAGVMVYVTDGSLDTDVPIAVREVTAIVNLGKCLGYALRDGSEAEGVAPLPDLACTPDGKCLLVIQDKKKVLAIFWGGALGVFARGIDG